VARSDTDVYAIILDGLADSAAHRLDHRGFVSWVFVKQGGHAWTLRIFATHGSGSGRRASTAGRNLEELASQVDGVDVIVRGHSHHASYLPQSKYRPGRKGGESVLVHAISIPPLCRDMAYAERRDYPDVAVGYVRLRVLPGQEQVRVDWVVGG